MYVYLQPFGGFNDILWLINHTLEYCKKYNRILLLNTVNSIYKINFSDYFDFQENTTKKQIIYDIKEIRRICLTQTQTVYPNFFNNKMADIIDEKIKFEWLQDNKFHHQGHILDLPNYPISEQIIVYSTFGSGEGYPIFKTIKIKDNLLKYCKEKEAIIPRPYLGVQVRNTDYKCDYIEYYEKNKTTIHSYKAIYLATDDKEVLKFFVSKKLYIYNFTTYPENQSINLHESSVDSDKKIKNLICDIFILTNAEKLLSNSKGRFINLVRCCYEDRNTLFKYYKDINIFDIVINIGPNDINIIEKQIKYTKKNIIGYRNIYIICYDDNLQISGCISVSENIFPFSKKTVSNYHGNSYRNNWYFQQLLKLYSGIVIPNILDKYLVIDADTFFIRPTIFYENDKCLYNYGTEYHLPYFDHMKKMHPNLIKIDSTKSGICHHMMFETKYIKELFNIIESLHNDKFYNVFLKNITSDNFELSGASEYEIYFNYMLFKHPDKIIIRPLKWKNTNSLNDLYGDYDYLSYHHWMIN